MELLSFAAHRYDQLILYIHRQLLAIFPVGAKFKQRKKKTKKNGVKAVAVSGSNWLNKDSDTTGVYWRGPIVAYNAGMYEIVQHGQDN